MPRSDREHPQTQPKKPEKRTRWVVRSFDHAVQADFVTEMIRCKSCGAIRKGAAGHDFGDGVIVPETDLEDS